MTQADADKIILSDVKAIMHRGEPPHRLLDPYVKAGLILRVFEGVVVYLFCLLVLVL